MQVTINGTIHQFEGDITIKEIIAKLDIHNEHFAVAHNQIVVPKDQLGATIVNDGDKLEIIHATAGG